MPLCAIPLQEAATSSCSRTPRSWIGSGSAEGGDRQGYRGPPLRSSLKAYRPPGIVIARLQRGVGVLGDRPARHSICVGYRSEQSRRLAHEKLAVRNYTSTGKSW